MKKIDKFLDYTACNPMADVTYHISDMVLAIHSDVSYLSKSKARSLAGGHVFLSADAQFPSNSGAVYTVAQIIKSVMSLASINAQAAVPARQTLRTNPSVDWRLPGFSPRWPGVVVAAAVPSRSNGNWRRRRKKRHR